MKSRNFVLAGSPRIDEPSARPATTAAPKKPQIQQYRFSPVPPVVKVAPPKAAPVAEVSAEAEVPTVPVIAEVEKPKPTRKSPRKSQTLPVMISFDGLARPISCKIADMSASGARLKFTRGSAYSFDNPANLPDQFTLLLPVDRSEVECKIAWRKETELGVRFVSIHKPMRKVPKT